MTRTVEIAVIGAGPAGCSAAVQCLRLGSHPLLIDRSGRAGGLIVNAWRIENYPGLEPVNGRRFAARLAGFLDRFGLQVEPGEVTGLTVTETGFLLDITGREATARSVIVATGTRAVPLDIAGAREFEGSKLFYEVAILLEQYPEPERIVVIGGGEAALDYSLTIAGQGAEVILLVRGDGLRANERLVEAVSLADRIETIHGVVPVGLTEDAGEVVVETASVAGDRTFTGQAVIAAIGREPTLPALEGAILPAGSARVATPVPGLYLAGDVRHGSLGQAGMAVGDGLAAARQAALYLRGTQPWVKERE